MSLFDDAGPALTAAAIPLRADRPERRREITAAPGSLSPVIHPQRGVMLRSSSWDGQIVNETLNDRFHGRALVAVQVGLCNHPMR